jgi:hypothetical protein
MLYIVDAACWHGGPFILHLLSVVDGQLSTLLGLHLTSFRRCSAPALEKALYLSPARGAWGEAGCDGRWQMVGVCGCVDRRALALAPECLHAILSPCRRRLLSRCPHHCLIVCVCVLCWWLATWLMAARVRRGAGGTRYIVHCTCTRWPLAVGSRLVALAAPGSGYAVAPPLALPGV